jgi:indoleamine 2,3-dioxygenase
MYQEDYLQVTYDISPKYGFLSEPYMSVLPIGFEIFENIINNINTSDHSNFRKLVRELKQHEYDQNYYKTLINTLTSKEKLNIYTIFTFIVQKYVKNHDTSIVESKTIPYEIGIVWYESAKEFNLPNVTTYSAVILNNIKNINNTDIISSERLFNKDDIDSIIPRFSLTNTNCEKYFYAIHIMIEANGKNIIRKMYFINDHIKSLNSMWAFLIEMKDAIKNFTEIMRLLHKKCDPEVFWYIVRVYLSGYTESNGFIDGLQIEHTDIKFKFDGGSAAQSTLIQAIDIVFNVQHDPKHGKEFLENQRKYMPIKHQNYLNSLKRIHNSDNKNLIQETVNKYNNIYITNAYNDVIKQLQVFRLTHYGIVHKYIIKFTANTHTGLGGLPFDHLKKFITDTKNTQIKNTNININTDTEHMKKIIALFFVVIIFWLCIWRN